MGGAPPSFQVPVGLVGSGDEDVVDSDRRTMLCVGAVVLRGDRILFVRQTYGKLKGMWSLPWGFVDGVGPDGSPEPPESHALSKTGAACLSIPEAAPAPGRGLDSTEFGLLPE